MTQNRKATVLAGQLVLAEPLDLPDGVEVTVLVDDEMSEEEREALEVALAEGQADLDANRVYTAEAVLAELRGL